MFESFRGNRPLWRYVSAMAVWQIGNGIFTAVLYIVIGRYLLLSASFPIFLMTYSAVLFMSMPIWLKLIYHFGKHCRDSLRLDSTLCRWHCSATLLTTTS